MSHGDAEPVVNMRELYVGLKPAQREVIAKVLQGVDRSARECAAQQAAVSAGKVARSHALQRVRETGAAVAAARLEGEMEHADEVAAAGVHFRPRSLPRS